MLFVVFYSILPLCLDVFDGMNDRIKAMRKRTKGLSFYERKRINASVVKEIFE